MPTYPVINNKTGETKELSMSISSYDEWRKDNPDWDKDCPKGLVELHMEIRNNQMDLKR